MPREYVCGLVVGVAASKIPNTRLELYHSSNGIAMPRFLSALVVVIALAAPGFAWNKAGHMVTGAIAYNVLKDDSPEVLAKAVAILKAHPQYEKLWKKDVEKLPEADRDLYLFMLAARWADDIRGNKDYDQPVWHYINYPFKPDGQPDSVKALPPDDKTNIVKAFELNLKKLHDAPEEVDKAVPLCWLFHLIGDIQMPLHATSLFSETFPQGDRGGTRFYIKVKADSKPINLHWFWDDLITGSDDFRDVRNKAIELRLRKEFAKPELTELSETSFENWAKVESFELAKSVVYRNGKLEGGSGELSATVLPDDYPQVTKPVAERRGVLAGHRIAQVLRDALK